MCPVGVAGDVCISILDDCANEGAVADRVENIFSGLGLYSNKGMFGFSSISFFFLPDENILLKKLFLAGVTFSNFNFWGSIVSENISTFVDCMGVANIDELTLIALSFVSPLLFKYSLIFFVRLSSLSNRGSGGACIVCIIVGCCGSLFINPLG